MPSDAKTGCTIRSKIGYIAVGFSKEDDFWYSSEGVFKTAKLAIEDLAEWHPSSGIKAIKIKLNKTPT